MSAHRELRKLLMGYRKLGWRIEMGGSHFKLYPPNIKDKFVTVSSTPGNSRAIMNIKADLKRLCK